KRYASFIPGIRPGPPTGAYLTGVINRITFSGASFLGFITVILLIADAMISGISQQQMYLGGTAILIVVGVALDTMRQLQTQLVMRQYRGLTRGVKSPPRRPGGWRVAPEGGSKFEPAPLWRPRQRQGHPGQHAAVA